MIFSSFEASGQGNSDLKQYATFHYPNMYPQYGISMSYSIGICSAHDLKRPKSEVTVTVTPKQYATTTTPTKFSEICSGHDYSRTTEARGQVQSDPKMVNNTLHPKMHPNTEFGIPTFNSKEGMLQTQREDSGTLTG